MLCDMKPYLHSNFPDEVINLGSVLNKHFYVESMPSKNLWVKYCFQK